ncbi:hypothetical protein L6V77_07705 [Myxococcota bacterium]|nr:hypothetical protein [Myxococcota bacterium]
MPDADPAETDASGLFRRFDFSTYGRLLDHLAAHGRNVRLCDLADHPWPARFFILRHDVDFCPDAALRMAAFEQSRGIRATYFLLFGGRHYNLLAAEYCGVPARLAAMGHEVGLHYDVASLSPPDAGTQSRERALHAQAELLAVLAGVPVRSIAMHNPSERGEDPFRADPSFLNAYGDRFAREIVYASDSAGAWRDAAVAALSERAPPDRMQMLIHPFFWADRHADREERMRVFTEQRAAELAARAAAARASWARHVGVREHDARRP